MTAFSVAVLAGGKSSRMGRNKALVEIAGQTILAHILGRVSHLGDGAPFIVANDAPTYDAFGLPVLSDVYPDHGSLGGIYSAIHHSQTEYTMVMACDMPFVSAPLITYMVGLIAANDPQPDVIVPRVDGYPQGLFALYRKACLPVIQPRLEAKQLKVIRFYDAVNVRYLDESEYQSYIVPDLSFFNVNTPQDLESAHRLVNQQEKK